MKKTERKRGSQEQLFSKQHGKARRTSKLCDTAKQARCVTGATTHGVQRERTQKASALQRGREGGGCRRGVGVSTGEGRGGSEYLTRRPHSSRRKNVSSSFFRQGKENRRSRTRTSRQSCKGRVRLTQTRLEKKEEGGCAHSPFAPHRRTSPSLTQPLPAPRLFTLHKSTEESEDGKRKKKFSFTVRT